MHGHLLVSISSIFDDTRKSAARLIEQLDKEGVPVSLLVAPHIDGNWHLAKDPTTKQWLEDQRESGRVLILNGFDQAVQGRRAEFANLDAHEANLRLKGATRQMSKMGFDFDIFAPPRWRMSPGTLEVLPYFDFSLAVSSPGFMTCAKMSSTNPATCLMVRALVPRNGGVAPSFPQPSVVLTAATPCVCPSLGATWERRKSSTISCVPSAKP